MALTRVPIWRATLAQPSAPTNALTPNAIYKGSGGAPLYAISPITSNASGVLA